MSESPAIEPLSPEDLAAYRARHLARPVGMGDAPEPTDPNNLFVVMSRLFATIKAANARIAEMERARPEIESSPFGGTILRGESAAAFERQVREGPDAETLAAGVRTLQRGDKLLTGSASLHPAVLEVLRAAKQCGIYGSGSSDYTIACRKSYSSLPTEIKKLVEGE